MAVKCEMSTSSGFHVRAIDAEYFRERYRYSVRIYRVLTVSSFPDVFVEYEAERSDAEQKQQREDDGGRCGTGAALRRAALGLRRGPVTGQQQ